MKQLVNEFRDYARLPAAQLKPLDLNALVGEVLALYATAQEAGQLRAECAPELPLIVGDATQLRQVIHNLVQNALDAVAEQARRPRARAHRGGAQRAGRAARGAPAGDRQRPGLQRQGAQARVRTLRHDQEQGHRPRPGGGEEDRRRAWRTRAHRQPWRRQAGRTDGEPAPAGAARGAQVSLSFSNFPREPMPPQRRSCPGTHDHPQLTSFAAPGGRSAGLGADRRR